MRLFYFKPKVFDPLLIIVCKISNDEEYDKIESLTGDIFQTLIDQKEATNKNIVIFSIIRDHSKSTINLVLPSTKSNLKLTDRCHKDRHFLNSIVIETLKHTDTEFYMELENEMITINPVKLNLMSFSKFYSTK